MAIQMQYTTMIVENMTESVEFYVENMGFNVDSTFEPGPGTSITLMKAQNGNMIELIENTQYETGLYSLGMDVDDLDVTMADLKSKGYRIISDPIPTLVGRMTFTEDPNGIRIALIEHSKQS